MKFDVIVNNLLESTSPLRNLYHITYMANAIEILNSDTFKLSKQDGSGNILFGKSKYKYFMSAARNPSSSYFSLVEMPVIFELDASRLSDKGYPIKPIHDFIELDGTEEDRENISRFELEDRILSKSAEIPNAKYFIKAIHFYHNPDYGDTFAQLSHSSKYHSIPEAYEVFKNSGIPTFVYNYIRFFYLLNKNKARLIQTEKA